MLTDKARQARALYRAHLWRGRIILAVLATLLVLVVVRISLPYTIIYSSISWLGKQGITAHIEDISINVTKGSFAIIDARGSRNGEMVFEIGRALIEWEWRPLAARTIHIRGVELDGFDLIAEQHADAMVIAGIVIRPGAAVEPATAETNDTVAWGTSLNRIDFRDVGFCFKQYGTCLLYTSPSPRDGLLSRMPSSA